MPGAGPAPKASVYNFEAVCERFRMATATALAIMYILISPKKKFACI